MLTSDDLLNRQITQAEAAVVSGIKRGTISRLRSIDNQIGIDVPPKLTLADALSLHAGQHLMVFGVPATLAASAAHTIKKDWQRVADNFPKTVLMLASIAEDGLIDVAVCDGHELPTDLRSGVFVVSLTEIYRKALEAAEVWQGAAA